MKLHFIKAGEIVATHGIRGEMKILPWTDGPDFLLDFKRIRIDGHDYTIELCRIQKTCTLLKVKGIDDIDAAQALRGKIVEVYRQDVAEDLIFADELIGMDVVADDNVIGQIVDVLDYPGNKVYVIEGEYTYMIPAVREFILSTDLETNLMHVKLIEGMRTDEN